LEEDKQILEALLKTTLTHLRGNEIWKQMEKDRVCGERTYQSMRNRFLKNIFPDIKKLVCQNCDFFYVNGAFSVLLMGYQLVTLSDSSST